MCVFPKLVYAFAQIFRNEHGEEFRGIWSALKSRVVIKNVFDSSQLRKGIKSKNNLKGVLFFILLFFQKLLE